MPGSPPRGSDRPSILPDRLRADCPAPTRTKAWDWGLGVSVQTSETVPSALRVIEPKLMLPRVHAGTLRRARLLELLDDVDGAALTVLDAAVGYGKTTLLRSWCAERPEPVIWMTLDAADDDPVRLWTHLATAVERLGQGLGGRGADAPRRPGCGGRDSGRRADERPGRVRPSGSDRSR